MALFKKLKEAVGSVDSQLLTTGIPAWGALQDVQLNGTQVSIGVDQYRVCTFTVQVRIDGEQPYVATTKQRVHELALARLSGAGAVCVRVDPADRQHIAIDFDSPAPVVTVPATTGPGSRGDVLERGAPCEVVVAQSQPMGLRSQEGHDITGFALTVVPAEGTPYQAQVAGPVPAVNLPQVFPGSRLPARVLPEDPNAVVIDWAAVA